MDGEWHIDDPRAQEFIATVRPIFEADEPIEDRLAKARPHFERLLLADGWLPEQFRRGDPRSGMGGGIGTWLLYRFDDEIAMFSLVVEKGSETPVHDHLRWGLVGLHQGLQDEKVYRRRGDGDALDLVETRPLKRGEIYDLIPPEGDIHSVATTSDEPSISIHILGGDIGCIWRHRFDVAAGEAHPFRSGYSNVPCADDEAPATA